MRLGVQNLYIDESGSGAIYEPPPKNYQYFNMAGVVLDNDSENKISSEIRKWKTQYLTRSDLTFHAVDFFEDFKDSSINGYKYKKPFLKNIKNFYHAAIDLKSVFLSINYQAKVFYIDLVEVRNKLNLNKYINAKQNILKDVINKEYGRRFLQPIRTIIEKLFTFHESLILNEKKSKLGYICFESQSEFDEITVKTFHKTLHEHNKSTKVYLYGKNILGLNFYTKASLCAALELSDFISYCSTQYLRKQINSKELHIDPKRLEVLLQAYKSIKQERKIYLKNVTTDCIQQLKNIHTPQKKASI